MKIFTKAIPAFLFVLAALCFQSVNGQSIINPADSVYTYNSAATAGTVTNPNQPAAGTIAKWIRTVRMSWNTNEWKCYVYNGMPFRVHFPHTYNPTANDGKKYPIVIFYHGAGEDGPVTDNEESLAHGGQTPFQSSIDNGTFDGYIVVPQSPFSYWDPSFETYMTQVVNYMITNNKVDPFRIIINGLSAGGSAGWSMQFLYPQYIAANIPMSSNNQGNSTPANLQLSKFTPIWTFQGGLDTWPDPFDAGIVYTEEMAAGSDYTYTIFSTLGHDTWDSCWVEPNFWPFCLQAYSSNPWPLHGQSAFCPGVSFSDTLGVAPQFDAYRWRMNGTIIPTATTNSIVVTQLGTYDCQVERGGIWSDWSHTPLVVSIRQPTVTPPITTVGLASVVIPSLSSPGVTLQVPTGYASYTWERVGSNTTIGSANTLNVTTPGQYIVEVTQTGGCSSSFGSPFTVISASGPNAPSPASQVSALALSQTSILLNWSQNPAPAHNETGFEIYQGTKSGGPYTLVAITAQDASQDTVKGLNPGAIYFYVIRAVDSTGASTTSNEASASTTADTQPPSAPGALTIAGTTISSVSLSWTASTDNVGVVAYDIYVNGVKAYSVPGNQTSFSVYSLTNAQSYVFIVKARDLAGNVSNPSNQVSGEALLNGIPFNYYDNLSTTLTDLPNYSTMTPLFTGSLQNFSLSPAIDLVQFGFLYQGYINIPTTGSYTFETASDDASKLYLGSLGALGSPYNFSGTALVNNDGLHGTVTVASAPVTLTAGIYPIAVAYLQQSGGDALTVSWKTPGSKTFVAIPNSAFTQSSVVNGTAPIAPSNLVATAQSYKAISLNWKDNSTNESGFEVWRAASANNSGSVIIGTTGAGVTTYIDSTASASTQYFYQVRSVNQYGASNYTSNYTEALFDFDNSYVDSTGNGHTLTAIGSPVFDATNKEQGADAIKLNGTNQAITINNTNGFLQENYYQRTIACWIKSSGTTGANRVIWDIGGSTNGLSLVLNSTTLEASVASASSRKSITTTFTSTGWNHIAVVYYGDSLLLYVNGVLATSNLALGFHSIATTTDGARIGETNGTNALNTTGGFFGGWVDAFGVYNTALTPDVIQTLMNFTFAQSNATTQALPALPAAPTSLTVTPTSPSTIQLAWQDQATNATNYQVYRSNNTDLSYVLLATLPGNAVSFQDVNLFSDAKYYYKVDAVNVGGASAFTPEGSAVTLDVPPVITQITNQQARYGTTTVIPVSAKLASGSGVITLTASNLPLAFATFTDNGNGTGSITLNPTISNAGSYPNITVTATDAFGGSSQTQFNLSVNNNFAPTLDSIANYTMNEGDTLTIPLNGRNVNTADTLTLSLNSVPNKYALTQGTNGAGSLLLEPTYAAAGVYTVTATINDNNGLSASRVFTLTVVKKSPVTTIYTRVKYQATAPAPWNNLTGPTTTNLLDQNGNVTSVGIAFNPTTWWEPYNGGPVTGNNSGVYPDAVLQEYYYFSFFGGPANPTVVLSGLNTSKKYDITFFGSSSLNIGADNGITTYSIGNQTVSLEVQANTQNTVQIDTVTPAPDGTITVTLGKLVAYPPGYLNALVIANHFDDGTVPANPSGLQAQAIPHGVGLTWTDAAYNETSYQVYRSLHDTLSYALLASLPANSTSYTDTSLSGNTLYYYKVNAINQYGAGGYSNQVSIVSPDRVPQITPIANVIMSNTQVVQVPVTATDDPTDYLTLTASGLPSFASFIDNGNGTGVITLQPTPGLQGTFQNVTVTATDLSDSSRSTSFTINVIDSALTYTYVNITTPDNTAPVPWNNLYAGYIPYAGTAFNNLLSQAGTPTGITVTMTDAWQLVAETGMKRRNGSDLYPETVSGSSFFASDNNVRRITVTGLNPALGYNFLFFISHNTSQSTLTDFTINGQTISLNGSQNSNKTAQINGVTPDATGTVVINCQKDPSAVYAMLSAMVIESYTPGSATPFSPADLRVLDYNKTNTINLQWQDRANNETGYEVWRAPHGGAYAKLATLPANSTTYLDTNLPANTAFDYIVRAVNGTNFSPYSNPVEGYTYASAVFVFLNRVWAAPYNFPSAPAPFNNLNWIYQALGTVWNNFTDENGLPTNVGMIQPVEWDEVDPFGASTGNNSGLFPDAAMDQGWLDFVGDSSYITLTGLDASKKYDISVFASCTDDGTQNASAVYHINGQAGILNAHLNTSGNLTFFGITPDQNGNVSIGVSAYDSSNSSFGILGNIVIKGYTPSLVSVSPAPGTAEAGSTVLMSTAATFTGALQDSLTNDKPLSAYPNPFEQSFSLLVPAADHDNIMVELVDASGRILFEQRFDGLVQGDNVLRVQTSTPLPPGFYFVSVFYINSGQRKLLKMIRQ